MVDHVKVEKQADYYKMAGGLILLQGLMPVLLSLWFSIFLLPAVANGVIAAASSALLFRHQSTFALWGGFVSVVVFCGLMYYVDVGLSGYMPPVVVLYILWKAYRTN